MQYGIATNLFLDRELPAAVERIAGANFRAVEPCGYAPHLLSSMPAAEVRAVLKTLRNEGVAPVSIHVPHGPALDLGNQDPAVRTAGLDAFRRLLEPFAVLGGEIMVVHPNHRWLEQTVPEAETSRMRSSESLAMAGDLARPFGLSVAVENMIAADTPRPGATVADLVRMIADCPDNVGVCLDTGHARLNGRDPSAEARDAGRHLMALHVHDNDGESDRHWPPGRGDIDWTAFLKALREVSFNGAWTLEVLARGDEDPDAVLEESKKVALAWGSPAGRFAESAA